MSCTIVVGLAYGDEGKGATTDALVRHNKADLVVRYNGGAQAAHNVITPDGLHHTFCQFGSGTFVPGVKTHLSRFVLVNPITMLNEETFLSKIGITDAFERTSVDKKALIITPYQKALNRLIEMSRGSDRHGSCGQGIGQTRALHLQFGDEVLFAGDLANGPKMRDKLEFHREEAIREFKGCGPNLAPQSMEWYQEMTTLYNHKIIGECLDIYSNWAKKVKLVDSLGDVDYDRHIVFEGAQGVLLDEKYGIQPHTTWTNTTCENAITLLNEIGYKDSIHKIGVLRSYFTRHGAGPFRSEASNLKKIAPEPHNKTEIYQESFKVGHFDMSLVEHALSVCKVDSLAINHLDIAHEFPSILIYMYESDIMFMKSIDSFMSVVRERTKLPISIEGYGPTVGHRRMK